jgi:2-polyprenyl-3-methyl-5-hydroxy-6-metoxy-1,4-benzoquinol methylase/ribosomal protein S27E
VRSSTIALKKIQNTNQTIRSDAWKQVSCPQCGSDRHRTIVTEEDRAIVRCSDCELMFVTPQLTKEARFDFMNHDVHPASTQDQYDQFSAREKLRVERTVAMLGDRRGRWLDVGCGAGVALSEVERAGFKPCGFEVRMPYDVILKAHPGWDIRCGESLAKAGFPNHSFDVASILDTLNHMQDPLHELEIVRKLMKPDGMLVCMVPNTRYLLLKNTGLLAWLRWGEWSHMHTTEYLNHFTVKTLHNMLEKAGFKIIRIEAGGPSMPRSPLRRFVKHAWYVVARGLKLVGVDLGVRIDIWAVVAG